MRLSIVMGLVLAWNVALADDSALDKMLRGTVIGKTSVRELHRRLGEPAKVYAHSPGVMIHYYEGSGIAGSAGARAFGVDDAGVVRSMRIEASTTRRGLLEAFRRMSFQSSDLNGFTLDVACKVPGQPGQALMLLWTGQGALAEASLSSPAGWTIDPNPCLPAPKQR